MFVRFLDGSVLIAMEPYFIIIALNNNIVLIINKITIFGLFDKTVITFSSENYIFY